MTIQELCQHYSAKSNRDELTDLRECYSKKSFRKIYCENNVPCRYYITSTKGKKINQKQCAKQIYYYILRIYVEFYYIFPKRSHLEKQQDSAEDMSSQGHGKEVFNLSILEERK